MNRKPHFIRKVIEEDIESGCIKGPIVLRFPPEPNGFLHIGHAKAICLNFTLSQEYPGAYCFLRFDDTNPATESDEYMQAIMDDVRWLGFDWGDHLSFASDYFDQLYEIALKLIESGNAYVCGLNAEEVKAHRGSLTEKGKNSPDRNRSIEENLIFFKKMFAGEFEAGEYTLRARIDMASGNINMRDPAIYRIKKIKHHRVGQQWQIFPLYDFTHPISDALDGVTHSLCTLEFQDHRPLYDWFIEHCQSALKSQPKQMEFSRLNVSYTITSKRKLKFLVEHGFVDGWDDPRMPTLRAMRRRGYTPASIRHFCQELGVSKQESIIDMNVLEESVRHDLNQTVERRIGILDPIKVVIENFPNDEWVDVHMPNHPQKPELGKRCLQFGRELYIDASDFQEVPENKFKRLTLGGEVRLSHAYVIFCDRIEKSPEGEVTCLYCRYDKSTFAGKKPADGRKIKGIIHWLSDKDAKKAEVRVYDRLFKAENPASYDNLSEALNPSSLQVYPNALVEDDLFNSLPESRFQWLRNGYFCADRFLHQPCSRAVFNLIVSLRESWS